MYIFLFLFLFLPKFVECLIHIGWLGGWMLYTQQGSVTSREMKYRTRLQGIQNTNGGLDYIDVE
jgi:hypothetical protein